LPTDVTVAHSLRISPGRRLLRPLAMDHFDYDLYEELGVETSCTEADVRSAYKKKALIHHPDRNGGVQSDEFLRLKQAYDVLVDGDKRRNYDAFHSSGEFRRDGKPLSAKEAAWLVDQQKRSWGVKEIHPFAVCILCDSCPCPADGVCDGCGMTYCQLCVRKMHCRGGMQPHYPLKSSTKFSEDLAKKGREMEREHKLLKGNSNQWLMHEADFLHERDVYRGRSKRDAPELVWYWAWGQTRYTVHLAMWLASEELDADVAFSVTDEGRQRIEVTPNNEPKLLDRIFAYEVNTSRAGEAFTYPEMHCMTFCMLKANPGQRWRRLFDGDSEGLRELPLGEPPHSVSEVQVDGFKPVEHYRVAGRKETESEWYEVSVNVPIPEACERKHVRVELEGTRLAVRVAGWMEWERKLQQRSIRWEDKHESRTHIDMQNSTWLLTRDEERDFKCVQFVLSEWQEGANKNQAWDVKKQLEADRSKLLLEDADPYHMYDLVEAEMYLRAGAVFKPRSKVREKAIELVEQMEKQMEKQYGAEDTGWRESPFADAWEDDADLQLGQRQLVVRDEEGGEVEEAAEWWAAAEREEKEMWNMDVEEQEEQLVLQREASVKTNKEQQDRAAAAAAARKEEEEHERNVRRKEQLLKNRELALRLKAEMAEEMAQEGGGSDGALLAAQKIKEAEEKIAARIGVEQAREAAASAARANPLPPKKIEQPVAEKVGAVDVTGSDATSMTGDGGGEGEAAQPTRTASLAKCGWYFEDASDEVVKVTVPLEAACDGQALPKEGCVDCTFGEFTFRLHATLGSTRHVLDVGELLHRIDPKASTIKVRPKTKKVIVELRKAEGAKPWRKLTAT
jgi:hypothetical protein